MGKRQEMIQGGEDQRDQLNFKHVSTALHLINSVQHSGGARHLKIQSSEITVIQTRTGRIGCTNNDCLHCTVEQIDFRLFPLS